MAASRGSSYAVATAAALPERRNNPNVRNRCTVRSDDDRVQIDLQYLWLTLGEPREPKQRGEDGLEAPRVLFVRVGDTVHVTVHVTLERI